MCWEAHHPEPQTATPSVRFRSRIVEPVASVIAVAYSIIQRTMTRTIAAAFLMLLAASLASAQEKGQIGLGMGYPASVLFLWHGTARPPVRPETAFWAWGTATGSVRGGGWSSGVGVSGLLYAGKWESLKTYVSPRFTYNRSSSTTTTTLLGPNVIGLPP